MPSKIVINQLRRYSTVVSRWKSVVGLEIHAQIASESKLFSGAKNEFASPVNSNVSLFDCAMPGTLPVLNQKCVEAGVLTALALNCHINPISTFDRKHYFYADMPAGYQITQQRSPLASDGHLEFQVFAPGVHKAPYTVKSKIKQIQLEQDSGKSLHDDDRSLVDLNRAGAPLMELVFEPDLGDGEEAAALVKELTIILQRLETCNCKMEGNTRECFSDTLLSESDRKLLESNRKLLESNRKLLESNRKLSESDKGALRVDANISVHRTGEPFGTRTEVKNIGSVRGVAAAVKYEIDRQIKLLENGGKIVNETRAWNAQDKQTVSMRDKEEKQDYRYMPEPNLPPLHLKLSPLQHGVVDVELLRHSLPEMPENTRSRLKMDFGITAEQAIILVNDDSLLNIFNNAVVKSERKVDAKIVGNIIINDYLAVLHKEKIDITSYNVTGENIADLAHLFQEGIINKNAIKVILKELVDNPNNNTPKEIVDKHNLAQIVDEIEITNLCNRVIAENEKTVQQYKQGKRKVLKSLQGAVAKLSNQTVNMNTATNILKKLLDK